MVVFSQRHRRVAHEPDAVQLFVELRFRQEALPVARELSEHEPLPGDRLNLRRQGVPGEREHKECRVRRRSSRRFVDRSTKLLG